MQLNPTILTALIVVVAALSLFYGWAFFFNFISAYKTRRRDPVEDSISKETGRDTAKQF